MTTVYYTDSAPGTAVNLLSESESLANWGSAHIEPEPEPNGEGGGE